MKETLREYFGIIVGLGLSALFLTLAFCNRPGERRVDAADRMVAHDYEQDHRVPIEGYTMEGHYETMHVPASGNCPASYTKVPNIFTFKGQKLPACVANPGTPGIHPGSLDVLRPQEEFEFRFRFPMPASEPASQKPRI